MKKLLLLFVAGLVTTGLGAQITANGNSGSAMTSYTNGSQNNPVFIWCSETLSAAQGSLTATPTNGTGPFTFNWFYHDQSNASWSPLTTQVGATSTVNGLASDGYRVEIRDAGNVVVDCFVAWVWNLNTQIVTSNARTGCASVNLNSTINTTGSFSYYNPPPPESLINASTQIQVCFTANHTFVSDLAFYLVGPPACGSPPILLSPNPGANGQGSVCNGGNNVNNLCFNNMSAGNLNVCTAAVPLSGTYSSYGASPTFINWSSIIGCNAAEGGWSVQIYDCIGADVGALTNSTITFSNLTSLCGSPTTISYNSGSINSVINDGSCTAATASIFQVPPATGLTTPIVMTATTTLQWTASAGSLSNATSANGSASGLPVGTTTFIQTATTSFGSTSCTADDTTTFTYALPVVSAGPDQTACSGASVTLSGSGASTYTWDNGVTNNASFTPAGTMTYTVTGTDAFGCQNTDQAIVNVGVNPTVNAGADQAVCPGTPVTLTGSGTATGYSWNGGITNSVSFTPAATQTYTVTGTDAAGCMNTDQVLVTVSPLPPVNAGTDQSICPGGPVTLSGSGAATYTWNNGVSNGVAFNPAVTQTYTVTGTDAGGCQNTDQVTVTINPLPPVNAGADQAVCTGAPVTLSGSGASSYTWNNGISNGTPFTPATTQTYTVTGTDVNGCQNTDQVLVTVNPLPAIGAGADQSVCQGASVTLSGTGGTGYSWTNGVTNGVAFSPGVGTVIYTVTGTNASGCQNTDQVSVTVNATPVINAGADQSVCPGFPVTLSGSGGASYSWNNSVSNGVAFTPAATQTYTVTGTNASGCQSTDQVVVTVHAAPVVNAGNDQAVCNGGNATLSGSGAVSYAWNNGGSNGVSFVPASTQTYTVTGTDANGCQDQDQVTVTVNALPVIGAGSDQTICQGTSMTLSGTGAVNYAWTNGVTNGNPFTPPTGSVTYTVTGTDANGCQGTDQVTIGVVAVPVSDINSTGPLSGYPGLTVTFSNASQNANSFDWNFGNGQTGTSTNVSTTMESTYDLPGAYTVVLTASNGICQDESELDILILPYEPLIINVPNVFTPDGNNINDAFFIDVQNGVSINVMIINRWGNKVMELTDFTQKWDGTVNGNLCDEGTYFFTYTIVGKDGTTTAGQGFVELVK